MNKKVLLENMTWQEVQERLMETDIAIIPVGSTEEHGPHLPVNNDTFTAFEISKKAAELAYDDVKTVVAPAIPYGLTSLGYPGTITLTRETTVNIYKEVAKSLIRQGFKKIIFVNGHGGNTIPLQLAISEIHKETGAFVAFVQYWDLGYEVMMEILETKGKIWGHACELETSISWALGQKVLEKKRGRGIPPKTPSLEDYTQPIFRPKIPIHIGILDPKVKDWLIPAKSNGIIGDATLASKEKGEKILQHVLNIFIDFLRRIKNLKLKLKEEEISDR
jgi:creatinine amidohydrolase